MTEVIGMTYEKIYYSLWETAQRYSSFCQFRVIGSSHDDRMIPMVELGEGTDGVFCLSGVNGREDTAPVFLVNMVKEYCQAYECGWQMDGFYEVRGLLDKLRLCVIPLLNPDGYEITHNGFSAIRNPIFRQMLRMQSIPSEEYGFNARGMDISGNFPTAHYTRQRLGQEPASENETRALIRIFQEYGGRGLLSFCQTGREIVYYHGEQGILGNQKSYRLARHMQKRSAYHLEKDQAQEPQQAKNRHIGTPEQYYMQTAKQPAFRIRMPVADPENAKERKRAYEDIHLLPLEYIFSLVN